MLSLISISWFVKNIDLGPFKMFVTLTAILDSKSGSLN